MNRRVFVYQSSLACAGWSRLARTAGGLHTQCSDSIHYAHYRSKFSCQQTLVGDRSCRISAVHVDKDNVIRTMVGLRPYRASGFVVRAEKVGETLVIHNYGHGGAGLSLSWGTAQLALQLGCPGFTGSVAVLGCGAVGLATAHLLQEAGFEVTIYAKTIPPDTTPNTAGGTWTPFLVADPTKVDSHFSNQLAAATTFAQQRYKSLLTAQCGVRWIKSYAISKDANEDHTSGAHKNMLPNMSLQSRCLSPAEHPFPVAATVRQSETLLIEPPIYLNFMMEQFQRNSGVIRIRQLEDRAAISQLAEKLVFNCTGLGSRDLFHDAELVPVRGQLTLLQPQPEIDYAVSHDELYMLLRSDGIVLGGTYEMGVASLLPNMPRMHKILSLHKAFFDTYRSTQC